VYKGQVLHITRRTIRRHYLFTPDEARLVEQLFLYALGEAARQNKIIIHCYCLMSTHFHIVITDVEGCFPEFMRMLDRWFACSLKVLRGWPGGVMDEGEYDAVELLNDEAIIKAIAYVIANPTAAGAVRYHQDWPGATTRVGDIGRRTKTVDLPPYWYCPSNPKWAKKTEVSELMPVSLQVNYGEELANERIAQQVRGYERKTWDEAKRKGWPFMGAAKVMRQVHTKRASSWEEFGSLSPRFSAAGSLEDAQRAVARNRKRDQDYDAAWAEWVAGNRKVVFPFGTWGMRVIHGARCQPRPPD